MTDDLLLPWQREGVVWLADREYAYLGDEAGL